MAPNEVDDQDLAPTTTEGYKPGQSKTLEELDALDKEDESLQRWKASLGLGAGAAAKRGDKKVVPQTLFLESETLPQKIVLDLTKGPVELAKLKNNPLTIKEGVEYSLGITFLVQNQIVSGMKYIQVVKRAGIKVDKSEYMIGSFGPSPEPVTKVFAAEESPSGMMARSGSYVARSRIVDDDGTVWLDFEWGFKIGKTW